MPGMEDHKQKTDVHYRSLDGDGNFNWRFIFDFEYLPAEQLCVVSRKVSEIVEQKQSFSISAMNAVMTVNHVNEVSAFFQEHFWNLDKTEFRIPPKLIIQIWDNDKFSLDDYLGKNSVHDKQTKASEFSSHTVKGMWLFSLCLTFIGSVELDLLNLIPPAKSPEKCSLHMLPGLMDSSSSKKTAARKSLFSQKSARGWWPCVIEQDGKHVLGVCFSLLYGVSLSCVFSWLLFEIMLKRITGESRDDAGDSGWEGDGGEACRKRQRWAKHESQTGPAKVRNLNPLKEIDLLIPSRVELCEFCHISPSNSRPDTSFFWFTNPCKTLKFIVWRRFKCLFIVAIILLLVVLFIGIMFYSLPVRLLCLLPVPWHRYYWRYYSLISFSSYFCMHYFLTVNSVSTSTELHFNEDCEAILLSRHYSNTVCFLATQSTVSLTIPYKNTIISSTDDAAAWYSVFSSNQISSPYQSYLYFALIVKVL